MTHEVEPEWKRAFNEFWKGLTLKGDPLHIPNPFSLSFKAGWDAANALNEHKTSDKGE